MFRLTCYCQPTFDVVVLSFFLFFVFFRIFFSEPVYSPAQPHTHLTRLAEIVYVWVYIMYSFIRLQRLCVICECIFAHLLAAVNQLFS